MLSYSTFNAKHGGRDKGGHVHTYILARNDKL